MSPWYPPHVAALVGSNEIRWHNGRWQRRAKPGRCGDRTCGSPDCGSCMQGCEEEPTWVDVIDPSALPF